MTFFFASITVSPAASMVAISVAVLQDVIIIPLAAIAPFRRFRLICSDDCSRLAIHNFFAVVEIFNDDLESFFVVVIFFRYSLFGFVKHSCFS